MTRIDLNKQDRGAFLVNCLAIVHDRKQNKVLIGKREKDPFIPKLEWCFPGGRPVHDKSLEESLKHEVKKKTNIDIKIKQLVFARVLPEHDQNLLLYYHCEPLSGELRAGEKFVEAKWVAPSEVAKCFSTSVDKKISRFLKELEAGS